MENRVGTEAIWSAIIAINLWHSALSWWKSAFFSWFLTIFLRFLPSNVSIKLFNSRFWWLFLSQDNQWIPCTSQNAEVKTLPTDVCVFGHLDGFHLLLPLSWLPIWLQSEVVDPCFIHCHIFMQKLLFVALKQLQTMLWIVNTLF